MMHNKKIILLVPLLFASLLKTTAQQDSLKLLALNQQIDLFVVSRNIAALDTIYASDFVFSHGSGKVEGKQGWLLTVGRADYPKRMHDSVKVELHPGLAIVKGKMDIEKINKQKKDRYHLRYIRVYSLRERRWELISHITTHEWHDL
jgi:hypothetical protein